MKALLEVKIKSLPHNPGVYRFLDGSGQVIYVGKAKSLANRVGQYFQKNLRDGKTKQLVEHIDNLLTIEVFSELEALILEAELIRKYRPKYNINLKDDKSYLYIIIRKEGEFSKLLTARRNDVLKSDKVFGPFPDSQTAKYIVRAIRRIFPFRDCSLAKFAKYQKLGSPCLYGHIKLCPAPCVGQITREDYQQNIHRIKSFLEGKQTSVVLDLRRKMSYHAKKQEYEYAEEVKKVLRRFDYVQQSFRAPREFMENPYLVDDIYETALKELLEVLPALEHLPKRIECYDVANISGKNAAVSMVVAVNGRLEKREYKKFRIKLKDTPDDFFMIREALTRRFLHEVREDLVSWGLPNLVVVDGGKGQVSVAEDVLSKLGLSTLVVGLAKKEDIVVVKELMPNRDLVTTVKSEGQGVAPHDLSPSTRQHLDAEFIELRLDRSSEALKLLQRLRDESHRFARVYHHYLRSRESLL